MGSAVTRDEQRQFLKGRTVPQLKAVRNIAVRIANDTFMPEVAKQSARLKIEDIDAEIAHVEQQQTPA